MMESLKINRYNIQEDFNYGSRFACQNNESYTVEDIALAKKVGLKLLTEYFQNLYNNHSRLCCRETQPAML